MALTVKEAEIWKSIVQEVALEDVSPDTDKIMVITSKTEAEQKVLIKAEVSQRLAVAKTAQTRINTRVTDLTALLATL